MEIRTETRAAPADVCIYCGATSDLTEEHIIPYAVGGKFILPAASCRACAKITSRFERSVLRGFMQAARIAGGFPTRRPRNQPTTIPIRFRAEDSSGFRETDLPISNALGMLILPKLGPATFLSGLPPANGINVVGVQAIGFGKSVKEVGVALKAKELQSTVEIKVTDFGRMLAKIGYCYAVASIGPYPFNEVPVLPFILGQSDDGGVWVGSADFRLDLEEKQPTHSLGLRQVSGNLGSEKMELLVAQVKLFANSGASGYEVVVRKTTVS